MSTEYCVHPECDYAQDHTHCASCGTVTPMGGGAICSHHIVTLAGDEWAKSNTAFCNFIHRHIEPPNRPLPDFSNPEWVEVA